MDTSGNYHIDIDWDRFDPWRPCTLRHNFGSHPLLETEALAALGKRCRGTTRWASFGSDATAGTNFDEVGRLFPGARSATDSIRAIDAARAWVLLRHVQADPAYRALVDKAFEPIQPWIERFDPGLYYRAGWIFVASPQTVTPFHIDRNHGLLLQIRGHKTVYVWDPDDREVVSERARDCFHTRHDLGLVRWQESFRERAHRFRVEPGTGVYIPQTSPHMVETDDESSVTVSFTYSTAATRRNAVLHLVHDLLHRAGVHPAQIGAKPLADRVTYAGARALIAAHGPGSRPPACPSLSRRSAYAVAD